MKSVNTVKALWFILASGTMGFFGEGYKYHKLIWPFVWIAKKSATFVAKTVTVEETLGNMSLKGDSSPKRLRPDCIFIDFKRWRLGGMLNAVGLSNFGLKYYLDKGEWQKRTKPFAISLMFVRGTYEERLSEAQDALELFLMHKHQFVINPILKLNASCPNVKCGANMPVTEWTEILDVFRPLGWDVVLKFNALSDVESVAWLSQHDVCKGICVSNTFPWNDLPDWIKQKVFSEYTESPLKKYGGGGYSGKHLLPIITDWIARARQAGITKPIIGGGGIFTPLGVWQMYQAGASAISIGSPLLFRPWMVPFNVLTAFMLFKLFPNKWSKI